MTEKAGDNNDGDCYYTYTTLLLAGFVSTDDRDSNQ